jgi:membrane protein implicated in regulation of membrane protease activity
MLWWLWILLGLALLFLEIATPGGFFFLFFGLGAVLTGTLVGLGVGGPTWLSWLLFSVLSTGSLLLFRNPLLARMKAAEGERPKVDQLAGEIALLLDDLPVGGTSKAELRGTAWTARNDGSVGLVRGQRCRVHRVEGLMLWLRAE